MKIDAKLMFNLENKLNPVRGKRKTLGKRNHQICISASQRNGTESK